MSVRIRHHVNPLRSKLLHIAPGALVLPPGAPPALEIELGCADAQFPADATVILRCQLPR